MNSRFPRLWWLFAILNVTAILANAATAPAATPASGAIKISIKNEYEAKLDFGPLGKGSRDGTDRAEGVLRPDGDKYVGTVDAVVVSHQTLAGMVGSCGPATYEDSQKLQVTGHSVSGFNPAVQSVSNNQATSTGRPSNKFLLLEFVPATRTTQQPSNPPPNQDMIVNCHTLIESEATAQSGMAFLPLNDSRWTMKGGGYIIVLPLSGVLEYTDTTIAAGATFPGPFKPQKSIWTIRVERLP